MNQGRIWCVVHPTVGLPLLLGSVALTSLAVHTAIMTHTTWMGNYWMGAKARVAEATPSSQTASGAANGAAFSMTVTPVPASDTAAAPSFVITVTPAVAATAGAAPVAIEGPTRTAASVPGRN